MTSACGLLSLRTTFLAVLIVISGRAIAAQNSQHGQKAAAQLNNVGVAYMNQQLPEKALHKFEDAYQADPSSVVPLVNAGVANLYLRKLPEAETVLKKAVATDPKSVRGWYSLGLTHFTMGNQDVAISEFQHALALEPNDANIHYFIGTIDFNQKKYPEAAAELEKALQLAPLHASAQFGLARVLQREGKVDEAREHLKRFQDITQSKIGTVMSTTYGEQGKLAMAEDMLTVDMGPGTMIPVKFVPTLQEASGPHGSAPVHFSGGACLMDMEGGGAKDMVVMSQSTGFQIFRSARDGVLSPLASEPMGLSLKGDGVSCAVGDYDNDGLPDLAVALADRVVLFHNLGHGKFNDATSAVGIKPMNQPDGLTFVDFDHDGDLDLFVTGAASAPGSGPNLLWRNNGNSTFTEWSKQAGLTGTSATTGAMLSDVNNDRAVDLIVAGTKVAPQIYENQREGAFKQTALFTDNLPAVRALSILDFNKDGWMDVIATHIGSPTLTLWRNKQGEAFERVSLALPGTSGAWGVTVFDFDNDGWLDLAAVVETPNGTRLRVLRNLGPKGFQDVSAALGLDKLELKGARSVIAEDVDGDGAADLIVTRQDDVPVVLHNVGGSHNHSLRLQLTGLADNKSAIGTKVEVFANGNWQKFEVAGSSGYMSQGPAEILAGLGSSDRVDIVRLLWPTGVPQDELDVAASAPKALTELDRRGSSCPVLFAWDGVQYKFVTDVIGAAVVGHWISPTSRNKPDTDEWVKIDGDSLRSRNGNLSVRFGEPMEEINYIDQLRLVAIDHPAGTEVYPDERFLNDPPFASGSTVVASAQAHPLAGAWDNSGRDVSSLLLAGDHNYVRDFKNLPYAGFAEPHTLTLDLGIWSSKNPLRLFAHGYVEYFSASSMYAAWQAGFAPQSPSIEALLPNGTWETVVADAGFPAGLPRTIVIDLTGKLPEGTRRIRLKTNLQIYWDQMTVDNAQEHASDVRRTELPLSSAHLAFRGYPKQIEGATPGDLTYDYQSISMTGPFQWQRGGYTRYGDVTPLLDTKDDHYVIFGSGEDIDAEFKGSTLPSLPAGWKRDYFFYADGFVKDMDFYEALPFTVAEMPFHRMKGYPYSSKEHFPEDTESLHYQLDWNDRVESGDRTQRFQFNYRPVHSEPIDVPSAQDTGGRR